MRDYPHLRRYLRRRDAKLKRQRIVSSIVHGVAWNRVFWWIVAPLLGWSAIAALAYGACYLAHRLHQ